MAMSPESVYALFTPSGHRANFVVIEPHSTTMPLRSSAASYCPPNPRISWASDQRPPCHVQIWPCLALGRQTDSPERSPQSSATRSPSHSATRCTTAPPSLDNSVVTRSLSLCLLYTSPSPRD